MVYLALSNPYGLFLSKKEKNAIFVSFIHWLHLFGLPNKPFINLFSFPSKHSWFFLCLCADFIHTVYKKCTHFCPFVYKYKTWMNLQKANNIFSSGLMILLVPPSKSSNKNYHSHKKHTAKCIIFSISKSKPFS